MLEVNVLNYRDAVCPVWDGRLPVWLVAGGPVLPSGHRERLLLPVPAAVLAGAGAEASLFRDLLGGGVPGQAGSLRRTADHGIGEPRSPDGRPAGVFGRCERAGADLS